MDIGSLYTDYYAKAATDAQNKKLSASASKDLSGASDEELMKVCKDFESYFVEQVLKQAMETFTDGDEMSSGSMSTLQGYYKDSLIKEYAGKVTENQDMGLAKILFDQMKRNYSPDTIKPAENMQEVTDQKTDDTSAVEAASTAVTEDE
ncbi:MAG: hypothetical protein Q4D29_04665 [Lachnospiraceae bacterium]|nr:hypothetical protein [Lachnospiraceae bacterium]